MLRTWPALLVSSALLGACAPAPRPPASPPDHLAQRVVRERQLQGRGYELVLPRFVRPGEALPLVVLLHGYSSNGRRQDEAFLLSSLVDEKKFALALPTAPKDANGWSYWNATSACCDFHAERRDDVAFLNALLDDAAQLQPIDAARVYVVGHSNGGFMAHRAGCELSARVAALVSLGGRTEADDARGESRCQPEHPVHVLQIQGGADTAITMASGHAGDENSLAAYPSHDDSLRSWRRIDACNDTPHRAPLGLIDLDHPDVPSERTTWACRGADVEAWLLPDSGHEPRFDQRFARTVWDWLQAHPRRASP